MRLRTRSCSHNSSRQMLAPLGAALVVCLAILGGFGVNTARAATAGLQGPDTDLDTMPNAWEEFFGLNPNDASDADDDPDADGLSNAQEYAQRRHPFGRHARYFAEGSTGYFDTSVSIVNLSPTESADVNVAVLTETGQVTSFQFPFTPRQRRTIAIDDLVGPIGAVSIIVESDQPVAADRSMTWGLFDVGRTLDSGTATPSTTWYFAEGATGAFLVYYLFENPGASAANVTVRYLREVGAPLTQTLTLPAHSRTTVFVNDHHPSLAIAAFGAAITSSAPILAERSMYLVSGLAFGGGSASSGTSQLATTWHFAEGATGPFFQAFLSLVNPGATSATATVTYHLSNGTTASKAYSVAANSRRTVYFNGEALFDPALAALATGSVWFSVSSTQPIAAERAMWWERWPWYEGHAASGNSAPATSWAAPDGRNRPGGILTGSESTYVLIANLSNAAGNVRVTLLPETGAASTRDLPLPAQERLTLDVGSLFSLADASFSVLVESLGASPVPIVVDYSRYRSFLGRPFAGGGSAPAIPFSLTPADTAPTVTATTPAAGATDVDPGANLSVTFSESVQVTAGTFTLSCNSTSIPVTIVGGLTGTTFAIDPSSTLPASTACTLTVVASTVTDTDTNDPPDAMAANTVVNFTTAGDAAPSVTSTTPAAGATGVATGTDIQIVFSEAVTTSGSWFQIVCTTSGTRNVGDTAVSGGPTTFTINPTADFAPGETCTVTVVAAQVTDQDAVDPPDTMAADHVFSFTIDQAPTVTAATPVNGAVNVSIATDITVTFSEPVTPTGAWFQIVCATSGTRNVGDAAVTGGPTTFTINPTVDFAPGELCTVTIVGAQVADQDAVDPPDTMAANHVFSFTTDIAPTVTATTPTDGATSLATTTSLSVTFSEPVTVTGNWFQIVCGTSGTRNVIDTVVAGGPTTFTIDPNADFAAGETCTVTIAAASVTDVDAGDPPDAMAADYVFSFTTDVAPSVTSTSPTDGSTGSTLNTNLIITFSEAVTVTGNWFQIVCTVTGTRNVADTNVLGGPTTYTIDPTTDFAGGESCTVTVSAAAVTDQDAGDPPDTMAADYVFTFTTDSPPTVTATTPVDAAVVTGSSDVVITFSESVNLTGTWFQIVCGTSGTRTPANSGVTGGPTTFTINPNVDFAAGESCTATIVAAQVADTDGIDPPDTMAANFVFSFSIDAAPSVTSTTPTNGATVATDTSLSITFNEPVNVTGNWFQIVCTSSGTRNVADTGVSGDGTTFTINPTVDFAGGETCTITVFAAQVTDQDAVDPPNNMTANFVYSVTTDATPSVTATVPTNGATQVASNANLSVTFSEAVNVTGNWFQIVCGTSGTRNVGDTVVSGGPTAFGINPNSDFVSGETCTVTVFAAQVSDQDAVDPPDGMAANFVFSFTIDVAPSVTSTTPTNGATGVLPTTTITVNFNESVNATTSSFTVECPVSSPRTYSLSSSPAASFTLTPTTALPEGVICTVTVHAAQITDADAGDPPDNMLADHVFTFSIPPNAVDDSRNATGNVSISTAGGSNFSVLSNDIGPGISITAFDTASVRGGTVSLNTSTGTLSYNPPAGYEGIDQFTYTITNAAGSDTAIVTMAISGMLWFIDDSAAACTTIAANCGRLSNPFSTLAAFEAVNGGATANGSDVVDPEAGDHVFIYSGSYSGGLVSESTQRIIGQGAGSTLATLSGITPATDSAALPATGGAKPSLTGAGITLGSNNQLHGLAFSGTSGAAIGSSGTVGTLVMSDITISNTSGGGISLTGGGTVTLTGTANTIATTTGTALNVANTNIGAAGLTFLSIAANGATNGIVLNNTGAAGGLTITGSGTAGSGGTIQNITTRGISLTSTRTVRLSFMNLTNANTTDAGGAGVCDGTTNTACNAAVYLNGVLDADLTNINITGTIADEGINGVNVTDLDLTNVTISSAGNAVNEHGIYIRNLFGTSAAGTTNVWNNLQVSGSGNHNVFVVASSATNPAPGSPDRLEITGSSFTTAGNATPSDGITVATRSTANFQTIVTSSTFNDNDTDCIQVDAGDTSTSTVSITGSTFTLCNIGINLSGANTSTTNFTVDSNPTISSVASSGINLASNNDATLRGTISNNPNITTSAGNNAGFGIDVVVDQTGHAIVSIANNAISGHATGVRAGARNAGGEADVTVTGNTMAAAGSFPLYGIWLFSGNGDAQGNRTCANLSGNTIDVDGVGSIVDYALEQYSGSTFQIQGLSGSGSSAANVQSFVAATDLDPAPADPTVDAFVGTIVNYTVATCQTP